MKGGMDKWVSHKLEFRTRKIIRSKEAHYIRIKGLIHQEEITI